jgi:hypothetical protein
MRPDDARVFSPSEAQPQTFQGLEAINDMRLADIGA